MKIPGFDIRTRLIKKLKSKRGFTLVEILSATAIMAIVAMIMVLGVRLGTQTYGETLSLSGAKELCSLVSKTLSNELGNSGVLYVDSANNITGIYTQSFGGGQGKVFFVGDGGHLYFGTSEDCVSVLGEKVYSNNVSMKPASNSDKKGLEIKLSNDPVSNVNIFTVTVNIFNSAGDNVLASSTFEVKQLNYHEPITS